MNRRERDAPQAASRPAQYHSLLDWVESNQKHNSVSAADSNDIPAEPETGFASHLYQACLELLNQVFTLFFSNDELSSQQKAQLAHSQGRFRLWGDTLQDGKLETCVKVSADLQQNVVELLYYLGKVLIKATTDLRAPTRSATTLTRGARVAELEGLLEKASAMLSEELLSSRDSSRDNDEADSTSADEDVEMQIPLRRSLRGRRGHAADSLVRTTTTYTRLLMDLLPTIDHVYRTARSLTVTATKPRQMVFHVSEAAKYYVLQIVDKYRDANITLVERLGEANWQRHNFLRKEKQRLTKIDCPEIASHEPPKSIFQPFSVFHDSGLGTSLPAQSQVAISVASHTSFLSEEGDQHRRRVPKMPDEVGLGKPFECNLCGQTLSFIKNRIGWKMHVFADLKPYICTYENCPSALVTFPDRKSWAQHEFSCHRSDVIFKCDDCDRELPNEAAFSAHVEEYHVAKLSNAQLLALAAAAREIRHHPANEQLCPLCLQNGWQDERKFITHVAQHMEDIALGAVPRNDDTDTEATNAKSPHISTTTSDDSDKPSSSVQPSSPVRDRRGHSDVGSTATTKYSLGSNSDLLGLPGSPTPFDYSAVPRTIYTNDYPTRGSNNSYNTEISLDSEFGRRNWPEDFLLPTPLPGPISGRVHAQQKPAQRPTLNNQINRANEIDEGYYTNSQLDAQTVYGMNMNQERQNIQARQMFAPSVYAQPGPENTSSEQPSSDLRYQRPVHNNVNLSQQRPHSLVCEYKDCGHRSKTQSDFIKHAARHNKEHVCREQGCTRTQGFATINDLARHQKSVHKIQTAHGQSKEYKCFGDSCPRSEKNWPRFDNFKQHLKRMHQNENFDLLLKRSHEWYEQHKMPKAKPAVHALQRPSSSTSQQATSPNLLTALGHGTQGFGFREESDDIEGGETLSNVRPGSISQIHGTSNPGDAT